MRRWRSVGVCVGAAGATKGSEVNDQLAGTGPRCELTGTLHEEGLETERTQGNKNTSATTSNNIQCTTL